MTTRMLLFLSKNDPSNKVTWCKRKLGFPFGFGDTRSVNIKAELALEAVRRGEERRVKWGGWVGLTDTWVGGERILQ